MGLRRQLSVIGAMAGVAAVALVLAAITGAGTGDVAVEAGGENEFEPALVDVTLAGSIIGWKWGDDGMGTDRRHNVRQDNKFFYSGALSRNDSVPLRQFPAGKFHYYCENHGSESGGMDGLIKVAPNAIQDSLGDQIEVEWAVDADGVPEIGKLFDVRFRVDGGNWRTWKTDTSKYRGFFGRNDNPVNFNPTNHDYEVSSRAQKQNPAKHSGWSPPVLFGD